MIDAIDARARTLNARRALLWLLAVLPIVLGWAVGLLVYCLAFVVQSFLAGYRRGRGIVE